tara:strand:+ start:264 stop:488 length:225 start_codon:yes stop_codon:yes gene_type:complete
METENRNTYQPGDVLTSDKFRTCENVPYTFRTHKVDAERGVAYYYKRNGQEDSMGFSYLRKANPIERVMGLLKI